MAYETLAARITRRHQQDAALLDHSIADIAASAERAVRCRMTRGAAKYDPDDWRAEPFARHLLRGIRHAVTALELHRGFREADTENHLDHLAAAVCRLSMALAVLKGVAPNQTNPEIRS